MTVDNSTFDSVGDTPTVNPQKIILFWDWFEDYLELIEEVIDEGGHPKVDEVVKGMDEHIVGMGRIKWQLNTTVTKDFLLTLSPNNDRDLLKITKAIIADAPKLKRWNFHYAKPATGQTRLEIYDAEMDIQKVDAKNWLFSLDCCVENRHEITVYPNNTDNLDEDTEQIAVDLILTNLLGEEAKIGLLAGFNIDDSPEDGIKTHAIHQLPIILNDL